MGLDGVELIMATEEEFNICIPDEEAEQCVTVQKLVDVVYSKLRHKDYDFCLSQHGFYVVRRILVDELALKRSQIKPETKLEDVIPRTNRNELWGRVMALINASDTTHSSLVRPEWVVWVATFVLFGTAYVAYTVWGWGSIVVTVPVGIAATILGARITAPLKQELPDDLNQVKDLIRFVPKLNTNTQSKWSKDEVFQKIRQITVEQLGVEESEVTLETDYVKDLGI